MKDWKGSVYLFCAFTLAGTSVISARFVSSKLGTFTITAVSLFFALLFLIPICWKKLVEAIQALSVKDFFFLSIQALCGMFLFRMFLLNGLMHTSAGEAGILTGATPAITALLAMSVLKEPASGKKLIGMLSTVGGILLIQGLLTSGNGFSIEHFFGNTLVLCAAACESLFNIFSRIFAVKIASGERYAVHPTVQTTIVSAIALLFCLIPAMFENPVPLLAGIGVKEWLALFWYGLFVTALAFIFWYTGIKRCSAFSAAAFSGMMPFTSMVLSVLVLEENIRWPQWSGGILIIIGMVLIGSGNGIFKKPILQSAKIKEKEQVTE
ncbi:Permease of the drug/metabolite transporter (DMT) superfamily [Desulfosporosinus sp. I2]|uniref:DMT family transporter n=1 Tax=Desulfosporosinus sp. I2 TaxID=1617025 RepID=UPI0005EF7B1D|nr:DMT family transporter [Desulfosporosinus sp. I2]KJR46282.1 Permease of the drug/metabolite transporter (DMT) superfamily [Desulfosporosinus sp. I2]